MWKIYLQMGRVDVPRFHLRRCVCYIAVSRCLGLVFSPEDGRRLLLKRFLNTGDSGEVLVNTRDITLVKSLSKM